MFYDFIYLAKGFRMRPKVRSTLSQGYSLFGATNYLIENNWILRKRVTTSPALSYFFSFPSELLFWSYAVFDFPIVRLWNLVNKISREPLELGSWFGSPD